MIPIDSSLIARAGRAEAPEFRVVGIGGAGSNVLDRAVLDGFDSGRLIAVNTDVQSLNGCVAPGKLQIGRGLTRGLGTGGDPGLGEEAALGSEPELAGVFEGVPMVFLVAGLGGGTGSGATPVVARIARDAGAFVLALVTLPFAFEGRRRGDQALEALARLEEVCDAVVCFENDRMGEGVSARASVHEAFATADRTIGRAIQAMAEVVRRPGLIRIGLDDLLAALRGRGGRCVFGFGDGSGENRLHEAFAEALRGPLIDRGRLFEESGCLLVHVAGGRDLTLSEIEGAVAEFAREVPADTQILFGLGTDPTLDGQVRVAVLGVRGACIEPQPGLVPPAAAVPAPPATPSRSRRPANAPTIPSTPVPAPAPEPVEEPAPAGSGQLPLEPAVAAPVTPAPVGSPSRLQPARSPRPARPVPPVRPPDPAVALPASSEERPAAARQEEMQFEPVRRGRFEKSEPTLEAGEDLDIPTFLRKNIKIR